MNLWIALACGYVLGLCGGVVVLGIGAANRRAGELQDALERGRALGRSETRHVLVMLPGPQDDGGRLLDEISAAVPAHEWAEPNFHQ